MACSTACLVRPGCSECRVERVKLEMIMRHVMRFWWGRAAVTDRLSGRLGSAGASPSRRSHPWRENLSRRENLNFFPGEAGNDFLIQEFGCGVWLWRLAVPEFSVPPVPSCSKQSFFATCLHSISTHQDLNRRSQRAQRNSQIMNVASRRSGDRQVTANCPMLGRDNFSNYRGFCPNVLDSVPSTVKVP
jgi:hypothetical protein